MAKIAKRYAAVIDECYDNVGFYLVDLAYYTGEKVVHDRDDENLAHELIEEIENIGCIDLADETNFLVYDENYDQVEFTKEQLEEILKPLSWIKVLEDKEGYYSIDTSKMGEFNTNTESTVTKYIKDNSKAKLVIEDFTKFKEGRATYVNINLKNELMAFSKANKNNSLNVFGLFINKKKNIDDFLSKLSPENVLVLCQESKTSVELYAFENEKQFEEFKANSIAYKRYQKYLQELKSGKIDKSKNEEKEYTKERMQRDMSDPEFKKSSRYNAQMIISDIMKKLQTKELTLNTNDILKVELPEGKIVCLFFMKKSLFSKSGLQMIGFQNKEHYKDFANQNLKGKNIIEYSQDENEDDRENE